MNMIETMLVLLTLSILSSMISNSIHRFTAAHAYSQGQARLHEVGDRTCRVVSDDASLAVHVFTVLGDADAYLAKCDLAGLATFHATPPTATEVGYFQKDTAGSPTTGNYLFLAKSTDAFLADLVGDRSFISSVATYRLVLYVPVTTPSQNLDLARWLSQRIGRLNDVESIVDPVHRTLMGQKLYDAGFRFLWEPGRGIALGLRVITPSGTLVMPTGADKIAVEPVELRTALLQSNRMSIATNNSLPSISVPGLAIANGEFPGGFEVKVDGTAAGRMILVRMVVTGTIYDGSRNALAFSRTMNNR